MAAYFRLIFIIFIDIVYKILVFFAVYLVIKDWETEVVKVGPNLMESSGFWGSLHEADLPVLRVGAATEGFKFGKGGVGAWNHGLADVDPAGLVFAKPIQGLVDHP